MVKIAKTDASGSRDSDGESSDAELLALIANGDEGAFRSLIERHAVAAVSVARRMLRDDAEAEDVAQEAFLRVWRAKGVLNADAFGLRPWLRRVVSNLCIDRLRSGRRLIVVADVAEDAQPLHHAAADDDGLGPAVDAALKTLPDRQRLALTLFHFEGLSQVEVGGIMGVSDEAVESLLARARRALKSRLKDEWNDMNAGKSGN